MVIKEENFLCYISDATSKQRLPSKPVQHPTDSEQTLRDKTAVPSGTALEIENDRISTGTNKS